MINLIGLSGYISSGKSTVGQIIRYLTSLNTHISFREWEKDWQYERCGEWEIKGFSVKLKQIASILTGIPTEKFEDQEFKKKELGKEWWTATDTTPYGHPGTLVRKMTVRKFLQELGTGAIRDNLHSNTWVNALFADYTTTCTTGGSNSARHTETDEENPPNWIITDCRFLNEARAIKDKGGIVVRINRPEVNIGEFDAHIFSNRHVSEIGLNNWAFDYIINNDSDVEALIKYVKQMLLNYEVIH